MKMLLSEKLADVAQRVVVQDGNPSEIMIKYYNEPAFEHEKKQVLPNMLEIHKAHYVMLTKQGILSEEDSQQLKKILTEMTADKIRALKYDRACSDMFFATQQYMIERIGHAGGNLHLGRSRNDLGCTNERICVRQDLLKLINVVNKLVQGIWLFAKEHRDALMIEYTHMQHGQIGTVGHFMMGMVNVLTRDIARLEAAYATVNCSPLGSGAITTSGFPIDRRMTMEFLGFDDIVEDSYDAIAAGDHMAETASAVAILALDIGRFLSTLYIWAMSEFSSLILERAYVGISSMMPQKRNPAFEKLRTDTSLVFGDCQSVLSSQHNSSYEDILDVYCSINHVLMAMDRMTKVCEVLFNVVVTMKINEKELEQRAINSFAVMTEFADTLVRQEKVSYFEAHKVASALADECTKRSLNVPEVTSSLIADVFEKVMGRPLTCPEEIIRQSMDAQHFVNIRTVEGGPATEPMNQMLEKSSERLSKHAQWLENTMSHLNACHAKLEEAFSSL